MTVLLSYDPTLGRVQISISAMPAAAEHVVVERSTDGVSWVTVRGGSALALSSGAANLDDYEFADGVANTYRVSAVDTAAITFVAAGTASEGSNAPRTPGLPAGIVEGDLLLIWTAIRNSGAGTPDTPTGYTLLIDGSNARLFGKRASSSESAPTVNYTGGVVGATNHAQMAAFRNAELLPVSSNTQLNGSAQNVDYPALTVPQSGCAVLVLGWKQDDWTSVATIAGMTEIGDIPTVTGDDAGIVWDYVIQTTAANVSAGAFAVTGGLSAISRGLVAAFRPADYVVQQSANITPSIADDACSDTLVWVKSIPRPFLNRQVVVVSRSEVAVTRRHRTGVFNIVGRSYPVAVNDLRTSRQWVMYVRTFTQVEADELDLVLASGDSLLVQPPAGCPVPGGYVSVGDTEQSWHPVRPELCTWTLPLTEVAAPGPDVIGATITWAGVLATYATWADVMAAKATWADLLTSIGSPADVIVS